MTAWHYQLHFREQNFEQRILKSFSLQYNLP